MPPDGQSLGAPAILGGVHYAYHFEDDGQGWEKYDKFLLRELLRLPGHALNVLVRRGNVVSWDFPSEGDRRLNVAQRVLDGAWTTFSLEEYLRIIETSKPYVLLVSNLSRLDGMEVAAGLAAGEGYAGVIEIDNRRGVHWALYDQKLPHAYRLVGTELRLLHGQEAVLLEDNRPHGLFADWKRSGLFTSVQWENIGVRTTILDEHDTFDVASRTAATEVLAGDHMERLASEVVSRTFDLDPHLVEALHAALTALRNAETGEQLAQAALSCRRFLQRLADVLFPPQETLRGDRRVGEAEWKNRLWAYAEDAIGADAASVESSLEEVGKRIDSITRAADAAVHRPSLNRIVMQRLVVSLLSFTYDLLILRPPPLQLPDAPYEDGIIRFLRSVLTQEDSGESNDGND